MPMPVLEETKIGSPQVKTTVPGTPTTPFKAEVIVKKDLNSTPKMSTAVASSSQSVSMEKNASNNASRSEVKANISAPSSTNNNQNQNQNRNLSNNNSNKPVNGGTNQNQPKNNNNNNSNNNRQNNFNNNQKNNYNNKSQYGNNGINNGNSFNSMKNEPMKSAPKSFSNQNGNGSNSNSNNNSSSTSNSSNSNSHEMSSRHENKEKFNSQQSLSQSQQQNSSVSEKKFTGRCRLFVGNLPLDISEQEFKEIFSKYGEIGEVFLNAQRSFGFIKLDTRINAEHAKQDLDGFTFKGRCIRVRFASHGAAVRVKNLSPCVSNEYLEQAFSIFGTVERAVVIVDDKGRSTGEGIVEFERKPASVQCINKCTDMCFLLTSYPKPVVVEPLEQKDEEDGLPEKSIVRNNQYFIERETPAHFAAANSFEQKLSLKWRELYELEKQVIDEGKKRIDQAREMLEYEIEQALIDHKTMKLKEDLRAKQEELQRIEEMRKSEYQRRQDMENRRIEEERRRQDEMAMMRKQQENMNNPRNMNQNNVSVSMQSQFDQSHQAVLAQSGSSSQPPQSSSNNRRGGSNNNPNNSAQQHQQQQIANQLGLVNAAGQGLFDQNSLQFQHTNQALQQLPPAQQQALLAAQLCAMAAAAQQGGLGGMFDSPQINLNHNHINNNHGHNNHGNNKSGGGNKDDHRGSNNNSRRQFERRGGSRGGGRDDSYPGYDNKRARF